MENRIHVFVPFKDSEKFDVVETCEVFSFACRRLNGCGGNCAAIWENGCQRRVGYFLSFFTSKFVRGNSAKTDDASCVYMSLKTPFSYRDAERPEPEWQAIRDEESRKLDFAIGDRLCLHPQECLVEKEKYHPVDFFIRSVGVLFFKTGIGLVSFGVEFDTQDPFMLAEAEFLLKQSAEPHAEGGSFGWQVSVEPVGGKRQTLCSLAQSVALDALGVRGSFGFYSDRPRSDLLSWVSMDERKDLDYRRAFYYLGLGVSHGFMYPSEGTDDRLKSFGVDNIQWGVTNEMACCMVRPDIFPDATSFINDSLRHTFCKEYYLMFAWLLHQRYVLYEFLMDLKDYRDGDAAKLRKYKDRFVEFESDYVFARITEEPEYQRVFGALKETFALEELYADVREPIVALDAQLREEERRREKRMSVMLIGLAICGIFSAYVDSYDFIGKFFGEIAPLQMASIRLCQTACVITITVALSIGIGWVARDFFKRR